MKYESYTLRVRYKLEQVLKLYQELLFTPVAEIGPVSGFETTEHFRHVPSGREMNGRRWKQLKNGQKWGGEFGNLWLRAAVTVPEEADGQALYLLQDTGAYEALLFVNGSPAGMFNEKSDYLGRHHNAFCLSRSARKGERLELALECYAGHFCAGDDAYAYYHPADKAAKTEQLTRCYHGLTLAVRDDVIWRFLLDLEAVVNASRLPEDSYIGRRAREVMDDCVRELVLLPRLATREEIIDGITHAEPYLMKFFAVNQCDPETHGHLTGISGHSHLDTAWLWPMDETKRKAARTFAEALHLMEIYPDYCFSQSSMLHAEWMRTEYPEIFAKMRQRAAEGRWQLTGGSWVECDGMLPSGESIARQLLYGQRFAERYFGRKCDTFWLPDSFGFSAALPQLLRSAELPYFFTTKLDWNDLNEFPYSSFRWKGIDGSTVTAHCGEIDGMPDTKRLYETALRQKNRESCRMNYIAFGMGDGGGGPTDAFIELAERSAQTPDLPRTEYIAPDAFMRRMDDECPDLPVYEGELYLETHRGTLTSMSEIKRSNRAAEKLLGTLDFLAGVTGDAAAKTKAEALWKGLLQNQFHDILPGTALTQAMQQAVEENNAIIEQAARTAGLLALRLTAEEPEAAAVINPSPVAILEQTPVSVPGSYRIFGADGTELPSQRYESPNGERRTLFTGFAVESYAAKTLKVMPAEEKLPRAEEVPERLETPFYTVRFDEDGAIASLTDKRLGRELRDASREPLNAFYEAEDVPCAYDNWNIDLDTVQKLKRRKGLLSSEMTDGPVATRVRQTRALGRHSVLVQDIVFYKKCPRIDFESRLNWQDEHRLVKCGFALTPQTEKAKTEIQFGYLERPTHAVTREDEARFEVMNHRFTDLSEEGFGVALLNDAKYGLSIDGAELRLTLMKSGTHPDETGDEGIHEFTYSLLPHEGGFPIEAVTAEAIRLNRGPIELMGRRIDETAAQALWNGFTAVDTPNVLIETVKQAEDISDAIVLRLYEAAGRETKTHLRLPKGYGSAVTANLLEELPADSREASAGRTEDGTVSLDFRPFEVKTLLLRP